MVHADLSLSLLIIIIEIGKIRKVVLDSMAKCALQGAVIDKSFNVDFKTGAKVAEQRSMLIWVYDQSRVCVCKSLSACIES